MITAISPRFYTAQEVATMLTLNRSTVSRMAKAGKLPAARIGSSYKFPRNKIDQLIKSLIAERTEL